MVESSILLTFLNKQKKMDEKSCLITTIAFNAAPTLIHSKPSSLTSFTKGRRNLYNIWDKYKKDVPAILGIEYFELRRTPDRILVLFYKHDHLSQVLLNVQNTTFLNSKGYPDGMTVVEALLRLKGRIQKGFPHEIGIFLGYPIEDVTGFIEKNGKDYLLCKYWKVYHNPDRANDLFESYDRARIQVINSMNNIVEGSLAPNFRGVLAC